MIQTLCWNVNGIRACARQGFVEFLNNSDADVVALQEVRACSDQIPEEIVKHSRYPHQHYAEAEKKGYSGVAILSKAAPEKIIKGLGDEQFDREGRLITGIFQKFIYLSTYFPNSQDGGKRIDYKLAFCKELQNWLNKLLVDYPGRAIILAGDFNIAHEEIDLARPDSNHDTAGFLPGERAWMSSFLGDGWIDTYRHLYPDTVKYSWWSARTNARPRNIGWRIDYHAVNDEFKYKIKSAEIWDHVMGSDHCPVTLTLDI